MASVAAGAPNFGDIYNTEFQYSLPRDALEAMYRGVAFDNTTPYTEQEMADLNADIADIFAEAIRGVAPGEQVAVISAGAPGAGKTTLMERLLTQEFTVRKVSYTDPDAVCLKKMERTYLRATKGITGSEEEVRAQRKAAYDKWRPASNAINHWVLANLIQRGYPFYFGTTSSGDKTHLFYQFLKEQGYRIHVIHVTAPDDVRWQSILERDKTFVQTTEVDVVEKGRSIYVRIQDTFFKYADIIFFEYRPAVDSPTKCAATWTRADEDSWKIYNADDFARIKAMHGAHWPAS